MPAYSLSPDALEDLQDIWDFVAFDNVNAANHLEDEFFNAFEKLARRPSDGAHSPGCNRPRCAVLAQRFLSDCLPPTPSDAANRGSFARGA